MFNFGGNKPTATYGAIIDVGSGSVGVGIVESDHSKKLPKILFTHRELIRPSTNITTEEDKMRAMREALFSASLVLSAEGLKTLASHNKSARIKRILVTCASPWAHTISRNVFYKNEKDTEITEALVKNLVQDAEENIADTLQESAVVGSLGLQIVERATVNVRINGYPVAIPKKLTGKEVEITHITGLVPKEILESIEEVRDKILTDTELSVHTFMLVNYCILRDLFPKTESFCIVDVTGETTEVGIVENEALTSVVHAPYGSNTLIRSVMSSTKGNAEDVNSQLRSYIEKTASDTSIKKTEAVLQDYKNTLAAIFTKLQEQGQLPNTLVITALPQLEDLFKMLIPEIAAEITGGSFTVLEIKKNILDEIAAEKNSDTFITLASRFFHKLHGCGEIDTL